MENLIVNLFYLARPLLSVHVDITIAGMGFFDVATMAFTSLLGLLVIQNMMSNKSIPLSSIEKWIIAFILWCTLIFFFYRDIAVFKSYVKLILAPVTYLILKRSFTTTAQYLKALKWLIIGFSIPAVASAIQISRGLGFARELYYTGIKRYQGVYATIHDMGHSMALVIMLIIFYYILKKHAIDNISDTTPSYRSKSLTKIEIAFLTGLCVATLYSLYNSQARTAFVGLFIFLVIFFYLYSKKGFVLLAGTSVATLIVAGSILATIFFDVVESYKGERETEYAASGRIFMWSHNFDIYSQLPLDRQILGVGIGNKKGNRTPSPSEGKQIINSHNDWLQIYLDTGPIGFIIVLGLYTSIFLAILRLPAPQRYPYLAFFIAVMAMNLGSNSYISRFALSQMFYMVLVYLEIPKQIHAVSTTRIPEQPGDSRILSRKQKVRSNLQHRIK